MMMMKIMTISLEKILGVALFGRRRPDQCGLQLLHWPMLVPRPHTLLVSHFVEVRPELAHRYAIFLCSWDVEIS